MPFTEDFSSDALIDKVKTTAKDRSNHLYLNNCGVQPFVGITAVSITNDADDTQSIALGDLDNDGDLDVVVNLVIARCTNVLRPQFLR